MDKKVDLVMKAALKPRIGRHILNEVVYSCVYMKKRDYSDYFHDIDIMDSISAVEEFVKGMEYDDEKTNVANINFGEIYADFD